MQKATVFLQRLHQDSQEFGSDDELMVSRVFFDLEVDGKRHRGLFANLKQVVGSPTSEDAIEVSLPVGYVGPFNQGAFQKIIRHYFLGLVGASGSGIHLGSNSRGIRMRDNLIGQARVETFEIDGPSGGW